MAELSENKKYMSLEGFRVSYRKSDDTIHLTSTDEAFVTEGFHLTLKDGSRTEFALRKLLTENDIISEDQIEKWPSAEPIEETTWDKIPLGATVNGQLNWEVNAFPHSLISGATASGKSVLQRNFFLHLAKHKDNWRVMGIDLKKAELDYLYKRSPEVVISIAQDMKDSISLLQTANTLMKERYVLMEKHGVNNIKQLKNTPDIKNDKDLFVHTFKSIVPFHSIMIMVDEASMLLKKEGASTETALHNKAYELLQDIARLGRAAGMHLSLASQAPFDSSFISGEFKNNIDVRIAMGRHSATNSVLILDNNEATKIDSSVRGRAVVRIANETHRIQVPFQQ
jgi:DNA segregation ATPase FtsK/SpoIIIE-like protein